MFHHGFELHLFLVGWCKFYIIFFREGGPYIMNPYITDITCGENTLIAVFLVLDE